MLDSSIYGSPDMIKGDGRSHKQGETIFIFKNAKFGKNNLLSLKIVCGYCTTEFHANF